MTERAAKQHQTKQKWRTNTRDTSITTSHTVTGRATERISHKPCRAIRRRPSSNKTPLWAPCPSCCATAAYRCALLSQPRQCERHSWSSASGHVPCSAQPRQTVIHIFRHSRVRTLACRHIEAYGMQAVIQPPDRRNTHRLQAIKEIC